MKTLQELVSSYDNKNIDYHTKVSKLEEQLRKTEAKLDKLALKRPYVIQDFVIPLAKELKARMGLKAYEIYGPFGICGETTIYLSNNGIDDDIPITRVETWSITLEWNYNEDGTINLLYQTPEKTNKYGPNTIGALNGLNDVYAPLPDTIEEVIKLLRNNKKEDA